MTTADMTQTDEERLIFNKARNSLVTKYGADSARITNEANLVEDLGLDSLDAVEFMMLMESEFDVYVPDDVADGAKSVGQIVQAVYQEVLNEKFRKQRGN